ncbi:MAG: hypothetical protein ACYC99_09260 [Candidatus Geothermincolia bacterium]
MKLRAPREECGADAHLVDSIKRAGESLPPSSQAEETRSTFLASVEVARSRNRARAGLRPAAPPARARLIPALGAIAIAALVAVALVMSLGFASVRAMPGNPLYSLKRTIERTRVAVEGPDARVRSLLNQADERFVEMEYARSHGMKSWLFSLASDAAEEIGEAKAESSRLGRRRAGDTEREAGEIVINHEGSLRESVQEMPEEERGEVERWVDEEIKESEPTRDDDSKLEPAVTDDAPAVERDAEPVEVEPEVEDTRVVAPEETTEPQTEPADNPEPQTAPPENLESKTEPAQVEDAPGAETSVVARHDPEAGTADEGPSFEPDISPERRESDQAPASSKRQRRHTGEPESGHAEQTD